MQEYRWHQTRAWLRFVIRRTVAMTIASVALVLATFLMVRIIPGDPGVLVAGTGAGTQEIQQVRDALGLNRPLLVQLTVYCTDLVHGNWGHSFIAQEAVTTIIAQRLGPSVTLASVALVVVLVFGILFGLLAGAFTREARHQRAEVAFAAATSIAGAIPEFLAGTFLALIFAVWLRMLPVAGSDTWQALMLPVLAISLRPLAVLARVVRVETLNVLAQDYIRTARSKRLPSHVIYLRHVLPNVITAALTIGGLVFANVIGGAVVVENVFARPGLGTTLVNAVLSRDYPVIQGILLVLGLTVVLANAVVDVLLGIVDPRTLSAD